MLKTARVGTTTVSSAASRLNKQVQTETIKRIARQCGFELAGVARAEPLADFARYEKWVASGMAGEMRYLTDRRAEVRRDLRKLLPGARSVICVGKLYNRPVPAPSPGQAVISRYAWGDDYHDFLRAGLERVVEQLCAIEPFEWKICVDTAPLLERSLARQAGLGWIGRNTCLINEPLGSWFFLGEILTSLALEPDSPPPDRCGTCTRCIDACPTDALVPSGEGSTLDARCCISYLTIELRGPIPVEQRPVLGSHVFGCDICQDVCPWNTGAPVNEAGNPFVPRLEDLAALSKEEFRLEYGKSSMSRAKYSGFLRNVAVAMGNSGLEEFREPLARLTRHPDPLVAEHASWALKQLQA
jgi:epoxyqueuosine reductase